MDPKKIITVGINVTLIVALGLFILVIHLMGDRHCPIELKNAGSVNVSIKTIHSTGREWNMVVDSVSLMPDEKLEIGQCINCDPIHASDFEFNAIVVYLSDGKPKLVHRKDMAEYLKELPRVGCSTFELR